MPIISVEIMKTKHEIEMQKTAKEKGIQTKQTNERYTNKTNK